MCEIDDELKGLRQFRDAILSGSLSIHRGSEDVTIQLGKEIASEIEDIESILLRLKAASKNSK